MDGDLRLSNRSRTDETDATPIGSSVEDERDRSEGVADCVSGGIADDAKTSEVDSCVVEVDRAGFEDVESGLGFRSSDSSERKEMTGTVVESGGVVGEDEKYLEESAVEVLVDGGEVEVMDCYSNGDVVQQDEVHNVLDSSTAKPDVVVSVDDSRSDGIKMVSCFQSGEITSDSNNSSEIHGFSGVDGARKVSEDHEILKSHIGDESLSNGCATQVTELQIVMESKSDQSAVVVVKEGKDCVMNCSFTVSGDGISAGSMPKEFAGLDKKGTVSSWVNSKQEMNGKEKRAGRKGNDMNKVSGMNGNDNFGLRKCGGSKRTYLRKEMEALRYVNVEEQQKTWNKVHLGLGDVVARLLDTMGMVKPLNNGRRNNYRQNIENQKQKGPILRENGSSIADHNFERTVLGKVNSEDLKGNLKEPDPLYLACEDQADVVHDDCAPVEEYDEDDDGSDDEYDSIQRPAFLVEGDPDFESGSPKDGLEFLRRVRWELKYIPKVKVAKVDICKISNEQSVYMPKIPDIAKCPKHLMPCKKWEDAFLADFADLRLTISQLESSQQDTSNQPALSITEIESCPSEPELSFILRMDYVSRALLLKNWIRYLESAIAFSRKDCVWLFSLCASVDVPLDADMASYMRALLRKCSSLLAEKTEVDDEVVMLNILVTISGRFFKQLDH